MAVGTDYFRAKQLLNLGKGRLVGFDDTASQLVSIYYRDLAAPQQLAARGFTHPHAASQAESLHTGGSGKQLPRLQKNAGRINHLLVTKNHSASRATVPHGDTAR